MSQDSFISLLRTGSLTEAKKMLKKGIVSATEAGGFHGKVTPFEALMTRTPQSNTKKIRNELLDILIEKGVDVNQTISFLGKESKALVVLSAQSHSDRLDEIEKLLKNGADPRLPGCYRMGKVDSTPLTIAVLDENEKVVDFLLTFESVRASIDPQNGADSWSVLFYAASNDSCEGRVVEKLLKAGANQDIEDKFGRTPLSQARGTSKDILLRHKEFEVFSETAEKGSKPSKPRL